MISLKVLSSEMDPAEIRLIQKIFIKGAVVFFIYKNPPVPQPVRALYRFRAIDCKYATKTFIING